MRPLRPAYAKVGGPPKRWHRLVVLDAVTRQQLTHVMEANAAEGWYVRQALDDEGRWKRNGQERALERIDAPIVICDVCMDPDARDPAIPLDPPFDPDPEAAR